MKSFGEKKSKRSCENFSKSLTSCEKFSRKEIPLSSPWNTLNNTPLSGSHPSLPPPAPNYSTSKIFINFVPTSLLRSMVTAQFVPLLHGTHSASRPRSSARSARLFSAFWSQVSLSMFTMSLSYFWKYWLSNLKEPYPPDPGLYLLDLEIQISLIN